MPNINIPGGFGIPSGYPPFSIGQIKRLARSRLRGKAGRLVAPVLIYMIFFVVPVSALSFLMQEYPDAAPGSLQYILSSVLSLYELIALGPFAVSLSTLALGVIRDEQLGAGVMKSGFHYFLQSFCCGLLVSLATGAVLMVCAIPLSLISASSSLPVAFLSFIAAVLMLIISIVVVLRLQMVYFIAADDRRLRASAAVNYSWGLMYGQAGRLFMLELSFIGWIIIPCIPAAGAVRFLELARSDGSQTYLIIAIALIAVTLLCAAPVFVYIKTAEAVFYSNITGSFANAGLQTDAETGGQALSAVVSAEPSADGNNDSDTDGADDAIAADVSSTDAGGTNAAGATDAGGTDSAGETAAGNATPAQETATGDTDTDPESTADKTSNPEENGADDAPDEEK